MKQARRKKCRSCREWFQPKNSFQKACSPRCAINVAKAEQAKEFRAETRRMKEKIKTRSDYAREAQKAFNAWVRERDRDLPCISCGRMPDDSDLVKGSRWDAGHYRTTGANPELRFEPLNCHKQCVHCNRHRSGDITNFRIGLRERIGDEALEWLEGPHEPKKYTQQELIEIRYYYRAEVRRMKKERT